MNVGLTLTSTYTMAPYYKMGAISFFQLRRDIAYSISDEFGKHYEEMPKACAKIIDVNEYNARTDQLIKKYHCKERMIDFLYQSDVEGRLSPFKCKALFDQIANMQNNNLYGYQAYPKECMTIELFKEMLEKCYRFRVYMVWY